MTSLTVCLQNHRCLHCQEGSSVSTKVVSQDSNMWAYDCVCGSSQFFKKDNSGWIFAGHSLNDGKTHQVYSVNVGTSFRKADGTLLMDFPREFVSLTVFKSRYLPLIAFWCGAPLDNRHLWQHAGGVGVLSAERKKKNL